MSSQHFEHCGGSDQCPSQHGSGLSLLIPQSSKVQSPRPAQSRLSGNTVPTPLPALRSISLPDADTPLPPRLLEVLPMWVLALVVIFLTIAVLLALRFCGIYGYR